MAGHAMTEKRALQVAVAILALIPIGAGGAGVIWGAASMNEEAVTVSLDSHVRYLSGLLLAIGFGFWSTIPDIERKTGRARLLTALVVVGGIARLGGLAYGIPSLPMLGGLVMELVVTPALCLWQARIASLTQAKSDTISNA